MKHIKQTPDGLVERKTGRKIVSPLDSELNTDKAKSLPMFSKPKKSVNIIQSKFSYRRFIRTSVLSVFWYFFAMISVNILYPGSVEALELRFADMRSESDHCVSMFVFGVSENSESVILHPFGGRIIQESNFVGESSFKFSGGFDKFLVNRVQLISSSNEIIAYQDTSNQKYKRNDPAENQLVEIRQIRGNIEQIKFHTQWLYDLSFYFLGGLIGAVLAYIFYLLFILPKPFSLKYLLTHNDAALLRRGVRAQTLLNHRA